ncbi:hypothetical protein SLNWT_0407 [Streptomyces albus]|uniref:GPP34 family phosphoprotein n=1 Tax=Streptomyces albus (strain ATCC 21838 / DSM 41398 / FERM P-419 / JCM 4703 / NBRC 107858) TaxID=1081613 RepID=A0A0B5EFJ2_STRA4|nr:hypothetical protein SLNWT_0407 [Streptomyces albus]AOU75094.1 hypothetical protein SLNHY_0403 [Streptomyces albus]AYN30901.1 GPP34 family phosphoprotein [Streptomyces albus]
MTDTPRSLPACLYLLAWDTGEDRPAAAAGLGRLVRAGALAELAWRGLLADEDGVAVPTDPDAETGQDPLDGLLELVAESRPRTWQEWVGAHTGATRTAVREALVAEGFLRARGHRLLGLLPPGRHVLADPAPVRSLRARARAALCGPVPVAEVGHRAAAMTVLAVDAGLGTFATAGERAAHQDRTEALAARGGEAGPALPGVFRELRAAVRAAAVTGAAARGS